MERRKRLSTWPCLGCQHEYVERSIISWHFSFNSRTRSHIHYPIIFGPQIHGDGKIIL